MLKHNQEELNIPLDHISKGLHLVITPEGNSRCFTIAESIAEEWHESPYQLLEGNSYEYELVGNDEYILDCSYKGIIIQSNRHAQRGRICPNIFVGKLCVLVKSVTDNTTQGKIDLEILATKFDSKLDHSYRANYRQMLEDITEKCTDILMQINAPIQQTFTINFDLSSKTIYQRFSFINSIINTSDFENAVLQIIKNPATKWLNVTEEINVQKVKRINRSVVKQLSSGNNRMTTNNPRLAQFVNQGIPQKISVNQKVEHVNTAENRFIKHVLEDFLQFCTSCKDLFAKRNYAFAAEEADALARRLGIYLSQPFFQNISRPQTLKLNSPILQKRSGYRELLNRWLQFDLAAQLIWTGGDDIYDAGKKDIATLYEYWLFFVLYDLVKEKFNYRYQTDEKNPYGHLIRATDQGLNLTLKSGRHIVIKGVTDRFPRKLAYRFSYNRSFKGGNTYSHTTAGSWTTTLRPDYTLSLWPATFTEDDAEKEDAIVHIHFDAKYKVDNFKSEFIFDNNNDLENIDQETAEQLDRQKEDEKRGTYKNIDLLKMHAYNDAIRRTGGAYILYPGENKQLFQGFHEIIPGLGAFAVHPSKTHSGIAEVGLFLDKVIENLLDRTSQRERISNSSHHILSENTKDYIASDFGYPADFDRMKVDPSSTKVLVAFYKPEQWEWIKKYSLINIRTGESIRDTVPLEHFEYILLHTNGELETSKLYKLKQDGPKIWSKEQLLKKKYPFQPSRDFYLVFAFEEVSYSEFKGLSFDIRKLKGYKPYRNSSSPFVATLKELIESVV